MQFHDLPHLEYVVIHLWRKNLNLQQNGILSWSSCLVAGFSFIKYFIVVHTFSQFLVCADTFCFAKGKWKVTAMLLFQAPQCF